jgi:hypothetical protein
MAKTAPWFVHYACVPGLYPDSAFLLTASMPKPTQTTLYCRAVIANAINVSKIDYSKTTPQYTATAYLAHLLLRDTKPNAHAKAKEPNADAQFDKPSQLQNSKTLTFQFIYF